MCRHSCITGDGSYSQVLILLLLRDSSDLCNTVRSVDTSVDEGAAPPSGGGRRLAAGVLDNNSIFKLGCQAVRLLIHGPLLHVLACSHRHAPGPP